jgi:hypothetical protein
MKFTRPFISSFVKLLLVTSMIGILVISDRPAVGASTTSSTGTTTPGYSALKLFLEDEQHLTLIRRTKMIITFDDISNRSQTLIDAISDSSERDLRELEKLASASPRIKFEEFSDESIAMATLDSLRMTTAKEFLFEADDFEKNILISQLNILRVISHLAEQLEQKETNSQRKKWLSKISRRYEKYYQQVNARISITGVKRT